MRMPTALATVLMIFFLTPALAQEYTVDDVCARAASFAESVTEARRLGGSREQVLARLSPDNVLGRAVAAAMFETRLILGANQARTLADGLCRAYYRYR